MSQKLAAKQPPSLSATFAESSSATFGQSISSSFTPRKKVNPFVRRSQAYNTSIFSCLDDKSSCVEGTFCFCCFVSQEYNMLIRQDRSIDFLFCSLMLLGAACFAPCVSTGIGTAVMRSIAKDRLNLLEENQCVEWVLGCCCQQCSACQVYREMSIRNVWPGGVCITAPYKPTLAAALTSPSPPSMTSPRTQAGTQSSRADTQVEVIELTNEVRMMDDFPTLQTTNEQPAGTTAREQPANPLLVVQIS